MEAEFADLSSATSDSASSTNDTSASVWDNATRSAVHVGEGKLDCDKCTTDFECATLDFISPGGNVELCTNDDKDFKVCCDAVGVMCCLSNFCTCCCWQVQISTVMHDTSTAMQDKPLRSTFLNISSSTFMLSSNDCYLLIEVVIFRLRNPRNSVRLFFSPLVSSNFVRHGCYIWTLYTCSARKRDHVLHGLWT